MDQVWRIANPYTQDIRIANPNGRRWTELQIRMDGGITNYELGIEN